MKVIITEKPSVARSIAQCLNVRDRQDGYIQGNGYQIVWAFGHLVELQEPEQYHADWKRWSLNTLPMIPDSFALKAKQDEGAQKQLNLIKQLLLAATEIICATDAGREGELIFRYIVSWAGLANTPFKRLWISSLTDEAIRAGFDHLQDGQNFQGLYRAAKCRSEADWLVGINATRLYTLKFAGVGQLWTLGRVQTPVLALVVEKDLEIARFTAQEFWELHTLYRNVDFQYTGGRFSSKADAENLLTNIMGFALQITELKGKQEQIHPPLLYDLTDLQKDLNLRHGFTAEQTLSLAQQLYEKKHITYPRTDSRYLSNDLKSGVADLIEKLKTQFAAQITPIQQTTLSERYFNDAKVTDHHAILPTLVLPTALSDAEQQVYQAIVLRFIAAFYPSCVKQITTVFAQVGDSVFKATGTIIENLGWQVLYKTEQKEKFLPQFVQGETGEQQPKVIQGKTTAPKPYNEATLLAMMESAGKTCEDETLKEALKEKGLGTPATRAAIIEVLLSRGYLKRQRKNVLSTDTGRQLIALIRSDNLKSAALTGEWEAKLKQIEHNQYDADTFMAEIKQFTHTLKIDAEQISTELGNCPYCGQPIIEGKKGYGCSAWKTGCKFVLWKQAYGITINKALAQQLLMYQQSLKSYLLKDNDQLFMASLLLNDKGELNYSTVEPYTKPNNAIMDCPLCNGSIIETAKAYSCNQWRNDCPTVIWKTIAQKTIDIIVAKKLLQTGETELLTGFKSKQGTEFSAQLKLLNGKVIFSSS